MNDSKSNPNPESKGDARYWQNWDKGNAAKNIDSFWIKSEAPWRKALVKHLKKKIPKGEQIFEVGCGTGLIFQELLDQKVVTESSYSGGDISLKMLELAKQRFPGKPFKQLDIFNLDLPDRSVENLINIHVIQHLPECRKPLSELLRVARRRLYIVSWFNKESQDKITFSDPSEQWEGQRFYNNRYSLPLFLNHATEILGRRLAGFDVHWFDAENCAIAFQLKD